MKLLNHGETILRHKGKMTETLISLRCHYDAILREKEKQEELHFKLIQESLSASKTELERRLIVLNDLRKEVELDRALLVKQSEYDLKMTYYDKWSRSIDKKITQIETRIVTWTTAIGVLFALIQIVMHFVK